jgi:hypothetical protein
LVGDELVLDCYRLARFYHQPPMIFLDMGMSEIRVHMEQTILLAEVINRENAASEDG